MNGATINETYNLNFSVCLRHDSVSPAKKDDVLLPFQGLGKSPWVMTTDRSRACRSTEWKIYLTLVRSELWAGSVVRHASLISQCWNIAFSFSYLESWNPTFFKWFFQREQWNYSYKEPELLKPFYLSRPNYNFCQSLDQILSVPGWFSSPASLCSWPPSDSLL